jgi:hypothetical protein
MNLPNYYIADLPADAELTPTLITEACQTLRRNREQYLARRTTTQLVALLGRLGEQWLMPGDRFRRFTLDEGPARTGFSRATLERGLDDFFRELTAEHLRALIEQDLGDAQALDGLRITPGKSRGAIARGPLLLAHIAAGGLPNPAFMSIVLGLLTRSAQFLKCASGAAFLPRMFAHSLYEADAKLAACLEIAEWRGGSAPLEEALFREADCVTATGSDESLAHIRAWVPARTRFLGYGHRVSFGYVAGGALERSRAEQFAAHAAADVAAWDQSGCLSPHVYYVQNGGDVMPKELAALLAKGLEQIEAVQPRGALSPELAASIASRRAIYEVRAAHSRETEVWRSADSTAWTVVFEEDPRFQVSCLNRFIYVKPVANLAEALHAADAMQGKVSTVGLAAPANQAPDLVARLADWGVTRVCPVGQMQRPPLSWRHDGRPALGDLVTWTDWEQPL